MSKPLRTCANSAVHPSKHNKIKCDDWYKQKRVQKLALCSIHLHAKVLDTIGCMRGQKSESPGARHWSSDSLLSLTSLDRDTNMPEIWFRDVVSSGHSISFRRCLVRWKWCLCDFLPSVELLTLSKRLIPSHTPSVFHAMSVNLLLMHKHSILWGLLWYLARSFGKTFSGKSEHNRMFIMLQGVMLDLMSVTLNFVRTQCSCDSCMSCWECGYRTRIESVDIGVVFIECTSVFP